MLGPQLRKDVFGGNGFPTERLSAGFVYGGARFSDLFLNHLVSVIVQVQGQRLLYQGIGVGNLASLDLLGHTPFKIRT